MYICGVLRELIRFFFWDIDLKFRTLAIPPKKMLIYQNRQYRTTLTYIDIQTDDQIHVLIWKTYSFHTI